MQEFISKLDSILKAKYPHYSKEELDDMISDYGEIGMLEITNKVLSLLSSEEKKYEFGELFSSGDTEKIKDFTKKEGIDLEEIFEEVSKKITLEILG